MKKHLKNYSLAHSHPTFCSLLVGNLPEPQKSYGGD